MRPRIVFAAPRPPWPLDNGSAQRMFHILSGLSTLGEVDLVCYAPAGVASSDPAAGAAGNLCREVHLLPDPGEPWPEPVRTYRDVLRRFVVSPRPYRVSTFPGRPLAERVMTLAEKADLLWIERLFLAEWLPGLRDRTIVDLDDIDSVKEARRLSLQGFRRWQLPLRLDNWKLRRLERTAPGRYASVAVCSVGDRGFFPPGSRERVLVVPNGVPAALLSRPRPREEPTALVFVGRMLYEPNLDAALWFIRSILPRVAAVVPGVRLYVVGEHRSEALGCAHDGRRVIVTGRVDDVAGRVSSAAVSVVPIRVAGGTRIKILEALALGTPVVSTSVGAEGLDAVHGRHLRIADTAESFASEVVTLLQADAAREALRQAGRALVRERFTWEGIGARLAGHLRTHFPAWESVQA